MMILRGDWALAGKARRSRRRRRRRRRRSGAWRAESVERHLRHIFVSADSKRFSGQRSATDNRWRREGSVAACREIPHPHIFVSADSKGLTPAVSVSAESKEFSAPYRRAAGSMVRGAGTQPSPFCDAEKAEAEK